MVDVALSRLESALSPYGKTSKLIKIVHGYGSVCYIIGIRKDIRIKIGKQPGDTVRITIRERN